MGKPLNRQFQPGPRLASQAETNIGRREDLQVGVKQLHNLLRKSDYIVVNDEAELFALTEADLPISRQVQVTTGSTYLADGDIVQAIKTSDLTVSTSWHRLTPLGAEQIQVRNGTKAELDAASLGVAEPAFETDTQIFRMGDVRYLPTISTILSSPLVMSEVIGLSLAIPAGTWDVKVCMFGTINTTGDNVISVITDGGGTVDFYGMMQVQPGAAAPKLYFGFFENFELDSGVSDSIAIIAQSRAPITLTEGGTFTIRNIVAPGGNVTTLSAGSAIIATRVA